MAILTQKIFEQNKQNFTKFIFPGVIIILFVIPVTLPEDNSWLNWADFAPSILNGGSSFSHFSSNDWKDATLWLKQNTPEDAVIASWWDYGYWITTLSERTTLVDNATLIDWQIQKMGYVLMTHPDNAWHILNSHYTKDVSDYIGNENIIAFGGLLEDDFYKFFYNEHIPNTFGTEQNYQSKMMFRQNYDELTEKQKKQVDDYLTEHKKPICNIVRSYEEDLNLGIPNDSCNPITKGMDADYLLIYIAAERFYPEGSNVPVYTLEGGGDESKKTWYAKISNHQVSKMVENDNITPTKFYMENTTLGMLTPFSIFKYVELNTGRTFDTYQNGFIPVYVNDLKFKDPENDPFYLVYASPSFYSQEQGPMSAVLVYKINHDYNPQY